MKKIILMLCLSAISLISSDLEGGIEAIKAKDYEKAKSALQSACDVENVRGCSILGDMFSGQVEGLEDTEKSILFYKKACQLKDAKSCYNLAYMYKNGGSVEKDLNKSVDYFYKGCHEQDGMSCYELAYMYDEGKGVKKNDKKAQNLFVRACDLGYVKSCEKLAFKFMRKDTQDEKKAIGFASKACNKNSASACGLLGLIYGEKDDHINASKFLNLACSLNDKKSCYTLSFLYAKGQGVEKDMEKSKQFAKKSCDLGFKTSCELFEKLEKTLHVKE